MNKPKKINRAEQAIQLGLVRQPKSQTGVFTKLKIGGHFGRQVARPFDASKLEAFLEAQGAFAAAERRGAAAGRAAWESRPP